MYAGFPTQVDHFYGTSIEEDVSLKLERLKHLGPGPESTERKFNAMQWQQMSAQWAAMMQDSKMDFWRLGSY